jgi:hypothetical protein
MDIDKLRNRRWLVMAAGTGLVALVIACGPAGSPDSSTTTAPDPTVTTQHQALPDGDNFVFLKSLDAAGHSAVVDPAQFLTGKTAKDTCLAEGKIDAEFCGEDGFYISNPAEENVTVPVSPSAQYVAALAASFGGSLPAGASATWQDFGDGQWHCQGTVEAGCPATAEIYSRLLSGDPVIAHVTVQGGAITKFVQQYTP